MEAFRDERGNQVSMFCPCCNNLLLLGVSPALPRDELLAIPTARRLSFSSVLGSDRIASDDDLLWGTSLFVPLSMRSPDEEILDLSPRLLITPPCTRYRSSSSPETLENIKDF